MPPLIDPFAKAERPSATGLVDPFESGTPGTREAPEPAGFWANMKTLAGESYTQATANLGALMAAGQWDNLDEDQQTAISEKMAEANKQYDKPEELDAYMEKIGDEAQDVGDAWDKGEYGKAALQAMDFLGETVMEGIRNPKGFAYMNAEQAANLAATWAPGIALGKAGAVAGSVASPAGAAVGGGGGFIVGAGLGSFAIETGAQIREFIQEQGGNPEDPEAQRAALADPDMRKQLLTNASKKGLPIAVFDAVANLMGIKLLKGITGPLSAVKRSTGALGAQVGGAGGGEAAGQKWATGKIDWPDLGAEVALEIGPGGLAEPGLGAWAARNKPGDKPTPESNATLNAQLDAFSSDRKRAVLFTPGETLPEELPLNSTMETLDSGEGTLVYWQDDPEALNLANNGKLGTVLGYGIDAKPEGSDTVVTARDEQGRVIQDVVTDGSPAVEAAAYTVAGEDGTVETRSAEEALAERQAERYKESERTRRAKVKQLTQQFTSGALGYDAYVSQMQAIYGTEAQPVERPYEDMPSGKVTSPVPGQDFPAIRKKLKPRAKTAIPNVDNKKSKVVNNAEKQAGYTTPPAEGGHPVPKLPEGAKPTQPKVAKAAKPKQESSPSAGINPSATETSADSASKNIKVLSDLVKTKPFITHGYRGLNVPGQGVMLEVMLTLSHNLKVAKAIIELIPTDVMDNLGIKKLTPKVLTHNKSVLKNALSFNGDPSVSLGGDVPGRTIPAIALKAAKNVLSSNIAGVAVKADATKGTLKNRHGVTPSSDAVTGADESASSSVLPTISDIDLAANQAATSPKNNKPEPTEAQKEAGNYKKGKVTSEQIPWMTGLVVMIENPAGTKRNPEWPALKNAYGYFQRSKAYDGDEVDVFLGRVLEDTDFYVIDQIDPKTGRFDEHKTIMMAGSEAGAKAIYSANYSKDWNGYAGITKYSLEEFKEKLKADFFKNSTPAHKLQKPKPLLKKKPKALSKITLSTEAEITETGDTILIEQNAAIALRQAGKRVDVLQALLNCLS